jgi:D-glycero-D-manno-heptose 1,7-bisphosphate phosphatase
MHDYLMFVVTNQAGITRGRLTAEEVEAALEELDNQLGDILTGWQICPHTDDDHCECRKPKGGMIIELADMYGVDLTASTMVGDQEVDRQAAEAAGVANFIAAKDFFGWK